MPIRPIDQATLEELGRRLRIGFAPGETGDFLELAERIRANLDHLDDLDPVTGEAESPDEPKQPPVRDDPYNAVISWCDVPGADSGPLLGQRFGLKDNIAVAGVPMTCGTALLRTYVPKRHAAVVDRLLGAGARIVAKLNMDALAWSGGADTSSYGQIRNPVAPDRAASGSSGGSAAALYLPEIDITLGTDQGGSIRVPASCCGVLGLKPTFGLVPYSGIAGMDPAVDHVGPMARTVAELASTLAVIAGYDGEDPRQDPRVVVPDYVAAVADAPPDLSGMRIGVLREAFAADTDPAAPPGTQATMAATRAAVQRLASLGASIVDVSVPLHTRAPALLFVMLMESLASSFESPKSGYGHKGRHDAGFDTAMGRAVRGAGRDLPATVRAAALVGAHLRAEYAGAAYAQTRELCADLTNSIDAQFRSVDYLVMPTATHHAHQFAAGLPVPENVLRGWDMFGNTISTDISGHPAISLPMAEADGLPVGVMFVAPRFADGRLLATARTVERTLGWYPA